jgi:hypothetical protein
MRLHACWLLKYFAFVGLLQYFDQGSSFRLLFLRVNCECNWPSFLATVFYQASDFNGNLDQWDVAKVFNMQESKSIRIWENAICF